MGIDPRGWGSVMGAAGLTGVDGFTRARRSDLPDYYRRPLLPPTDWKNHTIAPVSAPVDAETARLQAETSRLQAETTRSLQAAAHAPTVGLKAEFTQLRDDIRAIMDETSIKILALHESISEEEAAKIWANRHQPKPGQ